MVLRTTLRDCLYLNWALPAPVLPPVPEPLRHDLHPAAGREWGFASALLFYQDALRVRGLPLARVSFPQLNLRFNVLDGEGQPAVYFRRMLAPFWVVPGARLLAGQPVRGARLAFPRPSEDPEAEEWTWRAGAEGEGGLEVTGRRGAAPPGAGPELGSWEETVRYFRERRRGYSRAGSKLRRIETRHPRSPVWPMKVELGAAGLVAEGLGLDAEGAAALAEGLHSAWLCPEMALIFETASAPAVEEPVRRSVPAAG
jgi:hypothetical protein